MAAGWFRGLLCETIEAEIEKIVPQWSRKLSLELHENNQRRKHYTQFEIFKNTWNAPKLSFQKFCQEPFLQKFFPNGPQNFSGFHLIRGGLHDAFRDS